MNRIAILFSGKGTNFAHIVKTLHLKEVKVVVALTNNPNAEGILVSKEGLTFVQYDAKIRSIEKETLLEAIKKVLK